MIFKKIDAEVEQYDLNSMSKVEIQAVIFGQVTIIKNALEQNVYRERQQLARVVVDKADEMCLRAGTESGNAVTKADLSDMVSTLAPYVSLAKLFEEGRTGGQSWAEFSKNKLGEPSIHEMIFELERLRNTAERHEGVIGGRGVDSVQSKLSSLSEYADAVKKQVELSRVAVKDAQEQAESIVGAISERALFGDHAQQARDEAEQADGLRYFAGAIFIFLALVSLVGIIMADPEHITMPMVLYRTGCAGAILLAAFYFARESARHRTTSNQHLKITLGLNAIVPYTRNMPKEQRDEVLYQFALQVFSVQQEETKENYLQKFGVRAKNGDSTLEASAESTS